MTAETQSSGPTVLPYIVDDPSRQSYEPEYENARGRLLACLNLTVAAINENFRAFSEMNEAQVLLRAAFRRLGEFQPSHDPELLGVALDILERLKPK